jgi:ribosomal protein S18 acetylase RimI-like enzyme
MEKEKNLLGDIIDIFIEEKYRSMGLGKKLIEKAITKLKELGSDRLSIGVFFDNTNARKLYEKLGFKPRHMRMFKFI